MTDKTKPLRCRLGWHKFYKREIHMLEPMFDGQKVAKMAVLERCECGESRFAWRGGSMPTSLHASTKYMPAKESTT